MILIHLWCRWLLWVSLGCGHSILGYFAKVSTESPNVGLGRSWDKNIRHWRIRFQCLFVPDLQLRCCKWLLDPLWQCTHICIYFWSCRVPRGSVDHWRKHVRRERFYSMEYEVPFLIWKLLQAWRITSWYHSCLESSHQDLEKSRVCQIYFASQSQKFCLWDHEGLQNWSRLDFGCRWTFRTNSRFSKNVLLWRPRRHSMEDLECQTVPTEYLWKWRQYPARWMERFCSESSLAFWVWSHEAHNCHRCHIWFRWKSKECSPVARRTWSFRLVFVSINNWEGKLLGRLKMG